MQELTSNSIRDIVMLEANPRRIQPLEKKFQVIKIEEYTDEKIFYYLSDKEFYYEFFQFDSNKVKELEMELFDIILIQRVAVFWENHPDKENNLEYKIKVFKICKFKVLSKYKLLIGRPTKFNYNYNYLHDLNSQIINSGLKTEHIKNDVDVILNLHMPIANPDISKISERKIFSLKRVSVGNVTKYSLNKNKFVAEFSPNLRIDKNILIEKKDFSFRSKENSINSTEELKKYQDSITRHLSELKKEDEEIEEKKKIDSKFSLSCPNKINTNYGFTIFDSNKEVISISSEKLPVKSFILESGYKFMTPDKNKNIKSFQNFSNSISSTLKRSSSRSNLFSNNSKRITIKQLIHFRDKNIDGIDIYKNYDLSSQIFEVKCKIKRLSKNHIQTYEGCPKCISKIYADILGWKCLKCDLIYPEAAIFYNLRLSFIDHTGEIFLYLSPIISKKLVSNLLKLKTNAKEYSYAYKEKDADFIERFEYELKFTEIILKIKLYESYMNYRRNSYSPISNSKRGKSEINNQRKIDVKDIEINNKKSDAELNIENLKFILNLD